MKVKNSISFILILLLFNFCGRQTFESTQELIDYIVEEENGYRQTKEIKGVSYELQYRPTDLIVQQEVGEKGTAEEISELRLKYKKYMYFNLRMSLNGQELLSNVVRDKNQFGQMVNDLAFGMDQKVHLYTPQKDTLAMADFIYPRMYGMTRSTQIMIVYPRDKGYINKEYLNLTIEDLGLYTGEVKFKVPMTPINNEPELKF